MCLIYNLGILLYGWVLRLAAPFNHRAALLLQGRRRVWGDLAAFSGGDKVAWVHCASLGEFEQGRPLIEALRKQRPDHKVVLTFFSPSGYEVRKNYELADLVLYLPADTAANARRFIDKVQPSEVYFIKYEYWFHYFKALKRRNIPLYLVSAIFREEQIFFRWYGGWFRKLLPLVTRFFVQDERSASLLRSIGVAHCEVAGDTRFDRVKALVEQAREVPVIADFAKGQRVLVAGSTWPPDEAILANWLEQAPADVKIIVAPHEVHEAHVQELVARFKGGVARFSQLKGAVPAEVRVLVIDTIGLLSSLYRYGSVAYIGGGFGKGIHNTLEAATYGMPVIFGPHHKKFKEAMDLLEEGAAFAIAGQADFEQVMVGLWDGDVARLAAAGAAASAYVGRMTGATERVLGVSADTQATQD